jgi:hypothetical protein
MLAVRFIFLCLGILFFYFFHTTPSPSYSVNNDKIYGITITGLLKLSSSQVQGEIKNISKLGFRWIRTDFIWADIQPKNTNDFTWNKYNQIVSMATKYHIKILGILDYAPTWAAYPGCRSSCAPSEIQPFAKFALATALHYKGRVQNWEIWNEENYTSSWEPAPNSNEYADLLKASYTAIKKQLPTDNVISGGLSATAGVPGSIDAIDYLKQLYRDDVEKYLDGVSYHPYTYPKTPLDFGSEWNNLVVIHKLMLANGDATKKIWITEYGAPTDGPPNSYISQSNQSIDASESYNYTMTHPWIKALYWYTYKDSGLNTSTYQNFFGLVNADNKPKEAYYTWLKLLLKVNS